MKFSHMKGSSRAYKKWLRGLTLTEKIRTLEVVRLMQCARCQGLFGEECALTSIEDGQCHEGLDHRLVEYGTHVVVKRTKTRIEGCFLCGFDDNIEDAILEYFKMKKRGALGTCSK